MKQLLFVIIASVSLSCCQRATQLENELGKANNSKKNAKVIGQNITQVAHKYALSEKYDWKDVDVFYQGEMQKYANHADFNVLKNYTLDKILRTHNLPAQTEDGVIKKVHFYLMEMLSVEFGDAQLYHACLKKIAHTLSKDELNAVIEKASLYSQKFISKLQTELPHRKEVLAQMRKDNPKSAEMFGDLSKSIEDRIGILQMYRQKIQQF